MVAPGPEIKKREEPIKAIRLKGTWGTGIEVAIKRKKEREIPHRETPLGNTGTRGGPRKKELDWDPGEQPP